MKNFFEEKKRSLKFKLAGPGHKLNDTSQTSSSPPASLQGTSGEKRIDSIEDQEKRATLLAAVMQRSLGNTKNDNTQNRPVKKAVDSPAGIQSETLRDDAVVGDSPVEMDRGTESTREHLIHGVYFRCPDLDESAVLPAKEWKICFEDKVNELSKVKPLDAAIFAIKSLNSIEQRDSCISILCRYLKNIIENPSMEKYKQIKMSNPKFTEFVLNVKGGIEFLYAVGFNKAVIECDGNTEEYLVYNSSEPVDLQDSINHLINLSGFELVLDRDAKVTSVADLAPVSEELSDDFFDLTAFELKREQHIRKTQLDMDSMLMTKKMREMHNNMNKRRGKPLYTRIKVRLPNNLIIQGTFSVQEQLKTLRDFLNEKIEISAPEYNFVISPVATLKPEDEDKTFLQLNLHPAVELKLNISADKITLKG